MASAVDMIRAARMGYTTVTCIAWQAVHALTSPGGTLVFSAQSPVNASARRPVTVARIAVACADSVVHELDRGPAVGADSLAVARRAGRPSLFTWRSAGVLRSAER